MTASDHIETATEPVAFADWPGEIVAGVEANALSGRVGLRSASETGTPEVWPLTLTPDDLRQTPSANAD
ncbi:MAG: hypothetical protein QNJ13_11515 [Paracoccaceae bacterium]|nr:hypothetical protein [Paracoccaceae bacterium]